MICPTNRLTATMNHGDTKLTWYDGNGLGTWIFLGPPKPSHGWSSFTWNSWRWRVKCKVIDMLGYEPTWKSLSLICKLARQFGFHLGYFGLSDFDFLQFRGRFDWKTPVHPHCQGSNPPWHQVKSSASAQLSVLFAYFWMDPLVI